LDEIERRPDETDDRPDEMDECIEEVGDPERLDGKRVNAQFARCFIGLLDGLDEGLSERPDVRDARGLTSEKGEPSDARVVTLDLADLTLDLPLSLSAALGDWPSRRSPSMPVSGSGFTLLFLGRSKKRMV